jgi:VanZ family protein
MFSSYWPPAFLCAGLILSVSAASPSSLTSVVFSLPHGDKIAHSAAFAMLTFLCAGGFRFNAGRWAARYAVALAMSTAFGVGVVCEWYQFYVPFRSPDGWDLFANIVGSCLAVALGERSLIGHAKETS